MTWQLNKMNQLFISNHKCRPELLSCLRNHKANVEFTYSQFAGNQKARFDIYDVVILKDSRINLNANSALRLRKENSPCTRILDRQDKNSNEEEPLVRKEFLFYSYFKSLRSVRSSGLLVQVLDYFLSKSKMNFLYNEKGKNHEKV